MNAPVIRIRAVELFERPVRFRLPFRFGAVTLREARQAFVRVEVESADGRRAVGAAADLLAPKWFDKRPHLEPEETVTELVRSLARARALALEPNGPARVFDHALLLDGALADWAAGAGVPRLVAAFGCAQIERALADAVCRMHEASLFDALRQNLFGLDRRLAPELGGIDPAGALISRPPRRSIWLRHTVGLLDPLEEREIDPAARPADRLPVSLDQVIRQHVPRFFKLKLGGEPEADVERLRRIAALLDRMVEPYYVTLDGNEQFPEPDALEALWRRIESERRLDRLRQSTLYFEQPLPRERALDIDAGPLAERIPLLLDEGDDRPDAFARARARGWRGVSIKACKGLFRALANRLRALHWNREAGHTVAFVASEDLTTQAGLALQQDLALALACGCDHSERNGHHFAGGLQGAPDAEMRAFLEAHGDLYRTTDGDLQLAIRLGRIATGSLDAPGLGSRVLPDFTAMRPLAGGD